jgi:hypothetical protein
MKRPPKKKTATNPRNHAKLGRTRGRIGVCIEKMLVVNATGEK